MQNAKAMGIEKLLEKPILANGGIYEKTINIDG